LIPFFSNVKEGMDESAAVFAASSANEKSKETNMLGGGHGVFTHFLV
jgi:hypothetical protein